MPEITRRRLLGTVAGTTAAALIGEFLPPNLQRAVAAAPKPGSLRDIRHVVVIMQENRSFDHYFGSLAGVRGFDDPDAITLPTGRSVFYQPDPKNPLGYLLPFHLDTHHTNAQAIPSTSHAWSVQHEAWNGGAMDNWLPAHRAADGDADGPFTMGYYEWQDIPFQYALALAFTLCDGYFCSLMGPTWPNRLYLMSGTIDPDGTGGGPIISNVVPEPYRWKTYPERLTEAGVSWRVYQQEDDYGCNLLEFFQAFQDARPGSTLYDDGLKIAPPDRFEYDVAHGRLPTVSWIIPTSEQSAHPAYLPAAGADFVASKLDAIAADPDLWSKTVVIYNFDENDGLFDHVPPPVPPPGTPQEFVDGLPIGGGFRVPCTIISPWTLGGYVASEPFDHTSVLQFLEQVTGVREDNISQWRRQTFGDLTSALGMHVDKRFPPMPPTKPEFWLAQYEAANLPAPEIPGEDQTPPHQEKPPRPIRGRNTTPPGKQGRMPQTQSRLDEVTTSARGDYPDQGRGTNFPGILESVRPHAAAPNRPLVYVAAVDAGRVAVIDPSTGALVTTIRGLTNPYGIAATPDGAKLYVANSGDNSVVVLDPATNAKTATVVVGVYPHGVTASPDGRYVYVADTGPDSGRGGSRTISVIDTSSDEVVRTIVVGEGPQLIAVSPDGGRLYVTCADALYVVDAASGKPRGKIASLAKGHGVAVAPDGSACAVALPESDRVALVDVKTDKVTARIGVGELPWHAVWSPDGTRLYVSNADEDTVSVVDPSARRVVGTISVGHVPTGMTVGAGALWVANNTSSTISRIDPATNTVTATTELGLSTEPTSIVVA